MGSLAELYKIAVLLCPFFSSLLAILILLLDIGSSHRKPLKLNYHLLAYFISIFLSWFSAILYFYSPLVYVYINWLSMLAFILTQVFYYGFIFETTRINIQEKFSTLNYLFPVLLSLLLLIVSFITPVQDQLNTILSKGIYKGGSKLFFYLNYSKISFRLLYSLGYTIFGLKRLFRYRRFIRNFSSNEEKVTLRWVSTLLFFSMLLMLAPLSKIVASREEMVYSPIAILFVISLLFQYAYLCLHVIKRDRFIIDLSNETNMFYKSSYVSEPNETLHSIKSKNVLPNEIVNKKKALNDEFGGKLRTVAEVEFAGNSETAEDEISLFLKKNVLTRDFFDAFMRDKKPYLNADLKITDLVNMLHVNRTYISSFINREYGVNFSVFINNYRLLEYKVLIEMPEYRKMTKSELAEMAGFNSYRSFQRTKKEVSKSKKMG